jgi:hypothetical protein
MLSRMRGSRTSLLLVAAAVLLLVVLVAGGESAVPSTMTDVDLEPGLPQVRIAGSNSPASGLQFSSNDPALFAKVVIGIAAVMVVLALVLSLLSFLRNRLRDRTVVAVGDAPAEGTVDTVMRVRLREAVQQARDVLARPGGSPRDAVIQAWVTLENATDRTRAPHQTATEFTVSLLEKETADEAALRDLRTLYHRARFGHVSSDEDATQARVALDRILATIR